MCADPSVAVRTDNTMNYSPQQHKRCKTQPPTDMDSGKSDVIRRRLLHRLGIEQPIQPLSSQSSRVIQEGHTGAFTVALKDNDDNDHRHSPRKGSVCFATAVKVHPIPSRLDYSDRMRSVLWTPQVEIVQNAARNTLEFAAEGWDCSKVVEDDEMVLYQGEKIHPIHFVEDIQQHLVAAMR